MKKAQKIILIFFINFFFLGTLPFIYANSLEQKFVVEKEENYLKDYTPEYLLDTGDQIFIKFKGIKAFSKNYSINSDGEIFLPEIGFLKTRNNWKHLQKN